MAERADTQRKRFKMSGEKTKQILIAKYGSEEAYREHMKAIRKLVKHLPGGAFRDKAFAKQMSKKALEARWGKRDG